jgi:cysteine-rich repeat protein
MPTRFALLFVALVAPGCSVLVEDMIAQLPDGPPDGGMTDTRDTCRTVQDCLRIGGREVDCHVQCEPPVEGEALGRCERDAELDTPDGVFCGATDMDEICVEGDCVTRACGDGFLDRRGGPLGSEYCDDGNRVDGDGCDSDCSRSCVPPATSSCPEGSRQGECAGGAGACVDDVCAPPASPVPDGTDCILTGELMGVCLAGACVESHN